MARKGKFKREEATKDLIYVDANLEGHKSLHVCGSWRRGCGSVGDLDFVVVVSGHIDKVRDSIMDMSEEVLSSGEKITRSILPSGIQADFYFTEERLLGSYMLFLTGNKDFNIYCRSIAKRLGWRLSQYGLLDKRGMEVSVDEIGILEKLGMSEYANPSLRSISLRK